MTSKAKKQENPHRGSTLDDLLKDEGLFDEFQSAAIKNVIAFQLAREMANKKVSKTEMAQRMNTSRAQLNRLLDPKEGNVTLETLRRAAAILGREIKVELV